MHVVQVPPAPAPIAASRVVIHGIPLATDNLGWLLVDTDTGEALIVDGPEAGTVLLACDRLGARLTAVLNTHAHPDHIGVNRDLARRGQLAGMRVIGPAALAAVIPGLTDPMVHGDTATWADLTLKAIATPGHVDGHMAFAAGDVLFTGDALFAGGCGRLFDGPPAAMAASLARLAAFPAETRVYCAHEYTLDNLAFARQVEPENPALEARIRATVALRAEGRSAVPSTIGLELATNPFLRGASPAIHAALAREVPDLPRDTPDEVFAATRRLKDLRRYPPLS